MFISSMVLQWIMTFCTYQQKLEKCMKPQFHWEKCWTHFWPSMEDVNLSFFCADKLRVYPALTLILSLMEHFQGKAKNTVKHSIKSTFSISIQLNCNWLPGNPQLPPYIYIYIYILYTSIETSYLGCRPPALSHTVLFRLYLRSAGVLSHSPTIWGSNAAQGSWLWWRGAAAWWKAMLVWHGMVVFIIG